MTDLAERLKGVIEDKLAIARAANPGPWRRFTDKAHLDPDTIFGGRWMGDEDRLRNVCTLQYSWERDANAAHIVAHDPAWAIRQHEAALRMLERHVPSPAITEKLVCRACRRPGYMMVELWPCADLRDLADAYGVPVDTEETPGGTSDE